MSVSYIMKQIAKCEVNREETDCSARVKVGRNKASQLPQQPQESRISELLHTLLKDQNTGREVSDGAGLNRFYVKWWDKLLLVY